MINVAIMSDISEHYCIIESVCVCVCLCEHWLRAFDFIKNYGDAFVRLWGAGYVKRVREKSERAFHMTGQIIWVKYL